jgi:RNA polymerase sigma factor (sigma-70 family)
VRGEVLDDAEFRALFRQYFVPLIRYAERRLDDRSFAEDIVAETFLVAWNQHARGKEITAPWLYRTAANKLHDHYKRRRRKQAAEVALQRLIEEPPEQLDDLEAIALHAALASLTPRDREAVMLTYWEGLSAEDVAAVLGMTKAAVWTALSRARAHLRAHLTTPTPVTGGDVS